MNQTNDEIRPWYHEGIDPHIREQILRVCGMTPERDDHDLAILDLGCGAGRYARMFNEHMSTDGIVIGIDIDAIGLRTTRDKGVTCIQVDPNWSALPFNSNSFDIVFSSNVIEHIPRPLYLSLLNEVERVLKPGGIFAVGAPNYPVKRLYDIGRAIRKRKLWRYYLFDDPTHCHKVSVLKVESDLKQLFQDVRLEPSPLPFERRMPILRRNDLRYRLRLLGNKYFGRCVKAQ